MQEEKHYMLQPSDSRATDGIPEMIYGAHFKLNMVKNTTFQPLETREERFDILIPDGTRGDPLR